MDLYLEYIYTVWDCALFLWKEGYIWITVKEQEIYYVTHFGISLLTNLAQSEPLYRNDIKTLLNLS